MFPSTWTQGKSFYLDAISCLGWHLGEQILWAGMEQDNFPREGKLTCGHARGSCPFSILLSLWDLGCGELYWISTTPAVGSAISFGGTRGKSHLEMAAADSDFRGGEEGVLEGGIRLCKTIFR